MKSTNSFVTINSLLTNLHQSGQFFVLLGANQKMVHSFHVKITFVKTATGKARPPGMTGKDICLMHVLNNSSGKLHNE